MKFILLLITTFGYCFGYSQKRQEYKLINAVLANGNGVLTRKAHILDTIERINHYYHFTVRDLLIAQNNYKHEKKGVLFSNSEINEIVEALNSDSLTGVLNLMRLENKPANNNYIRIVKPIFFAKKKKAIISYQTTNCFKCSQGETDLYIKRKGKWVFVMDIWGYIA